MPPAPREGGPNMDVPMSSDTRVFNQMNVNHDQRVFIEQQQLVENKVLIQTHDPAYAEMIEQTAEARHRLAIAETEAQANQRHEAIAESLKEALKVHEAQEVTHARVALREKEENIKSEAVQHLRAHEAQCQVKVEAYQRILDANLRQSMATKDNELTLLRNQAAEKERVQEERIKKLEELVMQQSLQNQKLQSLLDSQLSQPPPVQAVETATLTRTVDPFVISSTIPVPVDSASPTSVVHSVSSTPGVNAVPPPYVPPQCLQAPVLSQSMAALKSL